MAQAKHPAMDVINCGALPHLVADEYSQAAMADDIGRTVRYNIPEGKAERAAFLRKNGTVALEAFVIVGIQKDWKGDLCYRAASEGDTFGRCIAASEVHFVD